MISALPYSGVIFFLVKINRVHTQLIYLHLTAQGCKPPRVSLQAAHSSLLLTMIFCCQRLHYVVTARQQLFLLQCANVQGSVTTALPVAVC